MTFQKTEGTIDKLKLGNDGPPVDTNAPRNFLPGVFIEESSSIAVKSWITSFFPPLTCKQALIRKTVSCLLMEVVRFTTKVI